MREINVSTIRDKVRQACIKINHILDEDVISKLNEFRDKEVSQLGRSILDTIIENAKISANENIPMCQDTGMVVAFVELGQDIHLVGGNITDAINEGVRQGYEEGYLRKSVVGCPIERKNTGDNTPAVIYYDIVEGDKINIKLAAKGFGSENMSRTKMLKPSDGVKGIEDFVIETVLLAGSNPCPPIIVGIGIGGTLDKAAVIAKKALFNSLNSRNPNPKLRELENNLLEKINKLGIGPQGLGGSTTALSVNVETFGTHIAGLPIAVNINCHASRHEDIII